MDEIMCDVMVTLDGHRGCTLDDALTQLKEAGLEVCNIDAANWTVEGTIDVNRLPELGRLKCVDYVRKVYTYEAEFPPGDPRDVNGM